jgi:hypothetical protein
MRISPFFSGQGLAQSDAEGQEPGGGTEEAPTLAPSPPKTGWRPLGRSAKEPRLSRWRIWLSYYEPPDRPDNNEMWRRRFPVTVLAYSEGEAFREALKLAREIFDESKYSVAVMTSEDRGLVSR